MMKSIVVISMIYLTTITDSGTSLKCYQCDFKLNENSSKQICGDPFFKNDSLLLNCGSLDIGCIKANIGVPGFPDKIIGIGRACVSYEMLKTFEEMQPKIGSLEFCDTDGCNGSQSLKSSVIVLILITMINCLFYWFN